MCVFFGGDGGSFFQPERSIHLQEGTVMSESGVKDGIKCIRRPVLKLTGLKSKAEVIQFPF